MAQLCMSAKVHGFVCRIRDMEDGALHFIDMKMDWLVVWNIFDFSMYLEE